VERKKATTFLVDPVRTRPQGPNPEVVEKRNWKDLSIRTSPKEKGDGAGSYISHITPETRPSFPTSSVSPSQPGVILLSNDEKSELFPIKRRGGGAFLGTPQGHYGAFPAADKENASSFPM